MYLIQEKERKFENKRKLHCKEKRKKYKMKENENKKEKRIVQRKNINLVERKWMKNEKENDLTIMF